MYLVGKNKWMVLVGRMLTGVGASGPIIQAYLSERTLPEQRSTIMLRFSFAINLAFVSGPVLSSGLSLIPSFSMGFVTVDEKNIPALFSVVLLLITCVVVACFFENKSTDGKKENEIVTKITKNETPMHLIICFIIGYFFLSSILSVYETLSIPITQDNYGWGISINGYLWTGIALHSALGLIALAFIKRYISEIFIEITSLTMLVGALLIIGFRYNTDLAFGSHHLPLWRFLLGTALVAIMYPIHDTIYPTLFSMTLGSSKQGLYFGCFRSAGSLSRILGPIWGTALYGFFHDADLTFVIIAFLTTICLCAFLLYSPMIERLMKFYKKLSDKEKEFEKITIDCQRSSSGGSQSDDILIESVSTDVDKKN